MDTGGLIRPGRVAPALADEHPGLGLLFTVASARPGRTPPDVRARLADLSDRWRGPQAKMLRRQPVVHAHRVFFRHIGIEPDVHRVPQEAAIVRRLVEGGFVARGMPADALTIATVETGVGVWAIDAATVEGSLGLRVEDDRRLVVADDAGVVAPLFGDPVRPLGRSTRALVLYAIRVPDVPELFAVEALERCAELLAPLSD